MEDPVFWPPLDSDASVSRERPERLIAAVSRRFLRASLDDIDTAIAETLAHAAAFVGADGVCLASFDGAGLHIIGHWPPHADPSALLPAAPENQTPWLAWLGNLVRGGGASPASATLADAPSPVRDAFQKARVQSALCVPLVFAGRPVGVLCACSTQPGEPWSDTGRSLLGVVAEILASSLQHKRDKEDLSRTASLLAAASSATARLLDSHDLTAAARRVLETVAQAAGADRVYVFENQSHSRGHAAVQRHEWSSPAAPALPPGAGAIAAGALPPHWVDQLASGLPIRGLTHELSENEQAFPLARSAVSFLLAPIRLEDQFWGFIGADDCSRRRLWSAAEADALATVGAAVGGAIVRDRFQTLLLNSRARYRAVVDSQTELVCRYLPDGSLSFVNDAYCRYYSTSRKNLVGTPFFRFVAPEDLPAVIRQTSALSEAHPAIEIEHRACLPDGVRWQRWAIRAIVQAGAIVEYQAAGRDITRQRIAEEQLNQLNIELESRVRERTRELELANSRLAEANERLRLQSKELERQAAALKEHAAELDVQRKRAEDADRMKSEFLANMSHELRTPLNSVIALSQLILSRGPGRKPEQDASLLQIIERSGRRLLSLIDDILDLSKVEAGRMELSLSRIAPRDVAQEAVDTVRVTAEQKGLQISAQIGDVPPIYSDEGKIRQILVNLLGNSAKFTEHGRIELRVTHDAGKVVFAVSDTGIGISPQDLLHIFEAFRQADGSITRKYGGTGLGLTISRKLARLLGGDITVQSELGKGSVFSLVLPLECPAPTPPEEHRPAPQPAQNAQPPDGNRRILIVEDNPDNLLTIQAVLNEMGAEHFSAADGQQGLDLTRQRRPGLILMDLQLPGLSGLDATRAIKADPSLRHIPVIALTAKAMRGDRDKALEAGCDDYLAKPFKPSDLVALVKKWLP
ncbi:MAG TPA: ATP-binding protein [Candidatus Brocadiia bacterium]|nr:ATP-binding protein [Candidatus Brocadiia bacterium]